MSDGCFYKFKRCWNEHLRSSLSHTSQENNTRTSRDLHTDINSGFETPDHGYGPLPPRHQLPLATDERIAQNIVSNLSGRVQPGIFPSDSILCSLHASALSSAHHQINIQSSTYRTRACSDPISPSSNPEPGNSNTRSNMDGNMSPFVIVDVENHAAYGQCMENTHVPSVHDTAGRLDETESKHTSNSVIDALEYSPFHHKSPSLEYLPTASNLADGRGRTMEPSPTDSDIQHSASFARVTRSKSPIRGVHHPQVASYINFVNKPLPTLNPVDMASLATRRRHERERRAMDNQHETELSNIEVTPEGVEMMRQMVEAKQSAKTAFTFRSHLDELMRIATDTDRFLGMKLRHDHDSRAMEDRHKIETENAHFVTDRLSKEKENLSDPNFGTMSQFPEPLKVSGNRHIAVNRQSTQDWDYSYAQAPDTFGFAALPTDYYTLGDGQAHDSTSSSHVRATQSKSMQHTLSSYARNNPYASDVVDLLQHPEHNPARSTGYMDLTPIIFRGHQEGAGPSEHGQQCKDTPLVMYAPDMPPGKKHFTLSNGGTVTYYERNPNEFPDQEPLGKMLMTPKMVDVGRDRRASTVGGNDHSSNTGPKLRRSQSVLTSHDMTTHGSAARRAEVQDIGSTELRRSPPSFSRGDTPNTPTFPARSSSLADLFRRRTPSPSKMTTASNETAFPGIESPKRLATFLNPFNADTRHCRNESDEIGSSRTKSKQLFGVNGILGGRGPEFDRTAKSPPKPSKWASWRQKTRDTLLEKKDDLKEGIKLEFARAGIDIDALNIGKNEPASSSPKKPGQKLPISVDPYQQANLYSKLELMVSNAANAYLMREAAAGHIAESTVRKINKRWSDCGRPQIVEFRFDIATQLELVSQNIQTVRVWGKHQNDSVYIKAMLNNWQGIVKMLSVRTFCSPDSVLKMMMAFAYRIFEMLGCDVHFFMEFQQIQVGVLNVIEAAMEKRKKGEVSTAVGPHPGTPWDPSKPKE